MEHLHHKKLRLYDTIEESRNWMSFDDGEPKELKSRGCKYSNYVFYDKTGYGYTKKQLNEIIDFYKQNKGEKQNGKE